MLRTILRRLSAGALLLAVLALPLLAPSSATAAADSVNKLAVHVDSDDPATMKLALNNIENVYKYFKAKDEPVEIELVAYGPGLTMLREDTSPVKDRLGIMAVEIPGLKLSACENTKQAMERKEGHEVPLLSDASIVPSGVVRLMQLEKAGYSYLKP